MTRILVVDDEPDLEALVKQKFRKNIKNGEFEFLFAENGQKALNKLDEDGDIDLILTDINMPEMDGLTLLTRINEENYFVKTVIVSAYGDMENIRTAMNLGAFDFITKPIDFKDLEVTMSKTIKHILELKRNTETLRENDTLKIYLKEIKEQKRLKDKFFAIISHDLRGPVSSFQGITDIMSMYIRKGEFDKLETVMKEIAKSTTQLSRLLDNLLNWASQELSVIPYNPEQIHTSKMIDDIIEIFEATAESKGIELVKKVPEELNLWADLNSTVTIFRNLVHNALKYTPEGGTITIEALDHEDTVSISVSDTGVGIPTDKMEQLFELTDKMSTYGTHGEKGVGLGLQLVNEFTKMNKGKIKVDSKEGSGTRFTVDLPSVAVQQSVTS
jgi:signal transduction histidine kinase